MINHNLLRTLCLCALPCVAMPLAAQQNVLKGKVIDQETGELLSGATLQNISSRKHSITDTKGNFSLQAAPDDSIKISYVGYNPIYVTGKDLRQRNNIMLSGYKQLNEVTVTASIASARNKKAIGASVANVDVSKLLQEGNGTSLNELLWAHQRCSNVSNERKSGDALTLQRAQWCNPRPRPRSTDLC